MNWIRRHPILTLLFAFGVVLLALGFELLSTFEDLRLLTKILNGDVTLPPLTGARGTTKPNKYQLAFFKGLVMPLGFDSLGGPKLGSTWEKGKRFLPSASSTIEVLASDTDRATYTRELLSRIASGLTAIPTIGSQPEHLDFRSPISNFRETRTVSRYWCFLASDQARSGNRHEAWIIALGPLLLAQHLESEESACAGVTLIARMIAVALRKMGTMTLIELAPQIQPNRDMALKTMDLVTAFEKKLLPISEILAFEGQGVQSCFRALEIAYQSGTARKMMGSGPSQFMKRLANPLTGKRFLGPIYDPIQQACGEPYPKSKITLKRSTDALDEIISRFSTPSQEWVVYVLSPTQFVFEFLISMSAPNFSKALDQECAAQQAMRGTGIAYVIRAFHQEHLRWPRTLSEAETWSGKTFPADRFTDLPLNWSVDASGTPQLTSIGADLATGTKDDLEFFPEQTLTASP